MDKVRLQAVRSGRPLRAQSAEIPTREILGAPQAACQGPHILPILTNLIIFDIHLLIYSFIHSFEMWSASLAVTQCWDYKCMPLCLAVGCFFFNPKEKNLNKGLGM
jgi:hypothetical protein